MPPEVHLVIQRSQLAPPVNAGALSSAFLLGNNKCAKENLKEEHIFLQNGGEKDGKKEASKSHTPSDGFSELVLLRGAHTHSNSTRAGS